MQVTVGEVGRCNNIHKTPFCPRIEYILYIGMYLRVKYVHRVPRVAFIQARVDGQATGGMGVDSMPI